MFYIIDINDSSYIPISGKQEQIIWGDGRQVVVRKPVLHYSLFLYFSLLPKSSALNYETVGAALLNKTNDFVTILLRNIILCFHSV